MRAWVLMIGLILIGTLGGCGTGYNTGLVAQEWGTSHKLAVANQTLNPDAEKNLKPVTGMENKAADNTITKYDKEFEKAPQVPVYNMQLPGSLGSATSGSRY
jgi:hypothetical protein